MNEWLHTNEHWVVFAILLSDLIGTVFLIAEYYFGRPDLALKTERNQQKRMRPKTVVIPYEKDMD